MLTQEVSSLCFISEELKNFCGCSSVLLNSDDKNTLSLTLIALLSYKYTMEPEDTRKEGSVTHRLVFINGVLDAPAALRDPGRVKHRDGWHSEHW